MSKRNRTSLLVERALREHTEARNSDKALIAYVLTYLGFEFTQYQIDVFKSLSFESITRARRKFQSEGRYVATNAIIRERRYKSARVQQTITQTKAENVPPLIEDN